jgi:hypothetical protein
MRICIIRFTKILCCVLSDSTNFYFIFLTYGYKKPDFYADFMKHSEIVTPHKTVFAKTFTKQ